jgi:hypothetical protein
MTFYCLNVLMKRLTKATPVRNVVVSIPPVCHPGKREAFIRDPDYFDFQLADLVIEVSEGRPEFLSTSQVGRGTKMRNAVPCT